jgi:inner membrane protein
MDSVTHIVLGAAMGEILAGKRLGKKALLIGAVANSLPDVDFLAAFWLDTSRDVWFHRGITHSFLFVGLMTGLLAVIARRVYRSSGMGFRDWGLFFGLELFSHIFIDAFNAYGTGWFEPFNHYRVNFSVLFVADPFYSCWLGIAVLALLILRKDSRARGWWARFGLLMSSIYLCYCLVNKWRIDGVVERALRAQGVPYDRYFTTPTPLNNWLWYVVVEDSAGYYTAYRSVFDSRSRPVSFRWQPRNEKALEPFRGRKDVGYLLRFSQGYYTIGSWKDSLVFNVLRFGEMKGWADPEAPFVFHYFLQYPEDNKLVVQRGRFAGWDSQAFRDFVRRIEGE